MQYRLSSQASGYSDLQPLDRYYQVCLNGSFPSLHCLQSDWYQASAYIYSCANSKNVVVVKHFVGD